MITCTLRTPLTSTFPPDGWNDTDHSERQRPFLWKNIISYNYDEFDESQIQISLRVLIVNMAQSNDLFECYSLEHHMEIFSAKPENRPSDNADYMSIALSSQLGAGQ